MNMLNYIILIICTLITLISSCAKNETNKWPFKNNNCFDYLAISEDGTIYSGSSGGNIDTGDGLQSSLSAITHSGEAIWDYYVGGQTGYPVVDENGTITVTDYDDTIFSLRPDGSENWKIVFNEQPHFDFTDLYPAFFYHAIGSDGKIYLTARSRLIALDKSGNYQWENIVEDVAASQISGQPPVIDDGGVIFVVTNRSGNWPSPGTAAIHAVSQEGILEWVVPFPGEEFSQPPAIGPDRRLYVSSISKLFAIEEGGDIVWEFLFSVTAEARPLGTSQPAVDADGTVYLVQKYGFKASDDEDDVSVLYAFHATGTVKWKLELEGLGGYSLVIGQNGKIYYATTSGVYTILRDGVLEDNPKTNVDIGGRLLTMNCAGTLYITQVESTTSYRLIALETDASGPADSPWPMFGHDPQHTGNQTTPICPNK